MTKKETETVEEGAQPTISLIRGRVMGEILKICGVKQEDFAQRLNIYVQSVSTIVYRDRLLTLREIKALRELVGEEHYRLALEIIEGRRREKEERLNKINRNRNSSNQ